MAARVGELDVLVVQLWTLDREPIVEALRAAGLDAVITRVDIEPALHAALGRARYDLVIYDPATTSMSLDAVRACLRGNRCKTPLIVADDLAELGHRVRDALLATRS